MNRQRETGRKGTAVVERGRDDRPVEAELPPPVSVEERLACVRDWLLAGKSSSDIALVAQQVFGVSRRTAFYYLARARAALTGEALDEGRSYNLRRTQLLRDRLFERLVRLLDEGEVEPARLRAVAQVVATAGKLLDTRDRSTQDLHVALEDGDAEAAEARAAACAALLPAEERCAVDAESHTPAALLVMGRVRLPAFSGEEGIGKAGGDAWPTGPNVEKAGGDACAPAGEKTCLVQVQPRGQAEDFDASNLSEAKGLEQAAPA